MKKQIAVLLNGGIKHDSRVIKICKSLSKEGDVHLFYIKREPNDILIFKDLNIFLHEIILPKTIKQLIYKHTFIHKEYQFFYLPITQLGIAFDLIYANDFPTLHVAVKLKKHFNATLVYDSHEIYISTLNQFFDFGKLNFIKVWILKLSLIIMQFVGKKKEQELVLETDYMLTVNESLQDYFINQYSPKQIEFLYNTPSLVQENNKVIDIRVQTNWKADDVIFLYQGVLNKGRGIELMIDAFVLNNCSSAKLLILGDGALLPLIKQKVKQSNLTDRIKFLGFVESHLLASYTKQADFSLFFLEPFNLSTSLASPNKIFQYIHAEVPIITNYTVENDKIFKKFNIGYQTKLSVSDISQIINYSVKNNNKEKFVLECKRAKQEYNWEKEEKKLLNIVRALL